MSALILDGKMAAETLKEEVRYKIHEFARYNYPCLAVVLVGNDPASEVYVRNKNKDCKECGIDCKTFKLSADASQYEVEALVEKLAKDDNINGIIVQLPLPYGIDADAVIDLIPPEKDVDCFRAVNFGYVFKDGSELAMFVPCTPLGVINLLEQYAVPTSGKHCVIVGRSNLVGKPLASLMLDRDCTVTVCHSKTKNLASITRQADILISAVGKRNLITADMVKDSAVVIDVGINRDENGKLCGDVDFDAVSQIASAITPVPGGIGPMTRAALMWNTTQAWLCRELLEEV